MITQLKKGSLEICVLSLINKKDSYGFEIVEKISEYIEVSEGSIYPLLRRLTKEGHIQSYIQESNEGPARKYYSLTDTGKEYYQDILKQWKIFNQNVNKLIEANNEGGYSDEKISG